MPAGATQGATSIEVYGFTAWITTGVAYGANNQPFYRLTDLQQPLLTWVVLSRGILMLGIHTRALFASFGYLLLPR